MTRTSTLGRWLWILLALVTVSAVLIAVGGSEASANPDGKTYAATIDPAEVTAGVAEDFSLTVTNESASTPLGAVNLTVPEAFRLEAVSLGLATATGGKSWSSNLSDDGFTIELRADTSADRLARYESVTVKFGATGLQQFVDPLKGHETYAFPIDARQANSFNGDPGNGLTYIGANEVGPEVRLNGVAWRCTTDPCELGQNLGSETAGTFALSASCALSDCGIIAIEYVFEEGAVTPDSVIYTPAVHSENVRAYLTLPKDELTKPASQYTFMLDLLKGDGPIAMDKCRRGDLNCVEKIERTKIDVTWIFRVVSDDPRMSW